MSERWREIGKDSGREPRVFEEGMVGRAEREREREKEREGGRDEREGLGRDCKNAVCH